MTPEEYFKKAKLIWTDFVPRSGQADTVQGELLRAIEKLRDEAHRNGNINFNPSCHLILIAYLRRYLLDDSLFDQNQLTLITKDLDRLEKENFPYTEDDLYDRINDRIVDWFEKNPKGLSHTNNPNLSC
ncbi:hypothetical protein [Fluviicola sp.]|uniref:hypothetical protein n=1 Tax=Fluviicola sp. TaxID=1917219 RepID=UPI003D289F9B